MEGGQSKLPVNVEGIASLQGIRTRTRSYDFAGRIYAEESGQLVMDLNADDSHPRRRFTAAHELMHTAFPGFTKDARYRVDDSTEGHQRHRAQEEYLCDVGAATLLMPRRLLLNRFSVGSGLNAVEALAVEAEVSLEAAGNRLVSLSQTPALFLVCEVMNKPADRSDIRKGVSVEPRLRIKYATASGAGLYIPRYKSADTKSVFARALTQRNCPGKRTTSGCFEWSKYSVEAKAYPAAMPESTCDGACVGRAIRDGRRSSIAATCTDRLHDRPRAAAMVCQTEARSNHG
jgi:hypothetical protein